MYDAEKTAAFKQRIDEVCEIVLQDKNCDAYGLASLCSVDAMIRGLSNGERAGDDAAKLCFTLGVYVGEVARRAIGANCDWIVENHQPVLKIIAPTDTFKLWPVNCIHMKLCDSPSSTLEFVEQAIGIATGAVIPSEDDF